MSEVNLNQFNFNYNNLDFLAPLNQPSSANQMLSDLFASLSKFFESFGGGNFNTGGSYDTCGCTSPPIWDDGSHPSGSLTADGNKITTPGGYTIEPLSQFEWKITGPDGKSTRIWGDPHVAEGDGGKWDFKRNSTFMLPDGTRINVTTAPWGSGGMTVTSQLEVISGNDRVLVTDIDKGKGKIGTVTADGYQHANSFGGADVFVMGKESDDWSYKGQEIIGSNNGGDSFKLGNQLAPGVWNGSNSNNPQDLISQFINELFSNFMNGNQPNNYGTNPYYGNNSNDLFSNRPYNQVQHRRRMSQAFRALADMFNALSRLAGLNDMMSINRNRSVYV